MGANTWEFKFNKEILPEEIRAEKLYILSWLINDGEWIEKGEPLFNLQIGERIGSIFVNQLSEPILSIQSGIVEHCKAKGNEIKTEEVIYRIHKKGNYYKENLPENPTFYSYFNRYKYSIPHSLKNSVRTLEIEKWYYNNGNYVNKGNTIISIRKSGFGYQSKEDKSFYHIAERNGYLEIKASALDAVNLQQGCLLYAIHDNNSFITSSKKTVQTSNKKANEECFVYLMIDTTNNFYKIGISNKPEWREKTLQSEKPTIELIAAKVFVNRKIASSFEKALHESYIEKRIRGEWFRLSEREAFDIQLTLEN